MFWPLPKNVWNKFILLIMWIQICNVYLPHFFYSMLVFFALQSVFLTRLVHCLHMAFSCWIPPSFSMFSTCLCLVSCISLNVLYFPWIFHLYSFLFSLFVLTYLFFKIIPVIVFFSIFFIVFMFYYFCLSFTVFPYIFVQQTSKLISHYLSLFVLICPAS